MMRWNKDHLDEGGRQEEPAGGPISWPHAEREEYHKKRCFTLQADKVFMQKCGPSVVWYVIYKFKC